MHTIRAVRKRDVRRGALMLVAMWGIGVLLLVTVIDFSRQVDRARKGQLAVVAMQAYLQTAAFAAIVATPATRAQVLQQLAAEEAALTHSTAELQDVGSQRYATRVASAIAPYYATIRSVAALVEQDQVGRGVAVTERSFAPGGAGFLLQQELTDASTGYRLEGERAEGRANVASVVLTLVLLLAFSAAFYRSMRSRKQAELLSNDKQALLEQSQADATTDALTGMANRRKLFDDTDRLLAQLADGQQVSLGIFDLDGFKNYNDSFGHPAGDALLAHLGRQLSETMAGHGTAYRMGGDEFCVVTAEPDPTTVLAAAAAALTEHGERFSIGCSYGVAAIPFEAASLEQALQVADRRLYGSKELTRSTQSVQIKDALMQVLAEQGGDLVPHLSRVAHLAGETGAQLELSSDEIARIRLAAELHDIGKAAVPAVILDKPGPLDATELAYLRQHSVIGERILSAAPALASVAPLVRATHERPDGTGYPDGLRLDQIPVGSRVIAVVDAFDAMTTQRPYQRLRTVDQALIELRRGAGTQFDPRVVDAFLSVVGARDPSTWHKLPAEDDERVHRAVAASGIDARRRAPSGRRAQRG
jgi:diguanylate cyclase (GGDEF)-like protein